MALKPKKQLIGTLSTIITTGQTEEIDSFASADIKCASWLISITCGELRKSMDVACSSPVGALSSYAILGDDIDCDIDTVVTDDVISLQATNNETESITIELVRTYA